MAIFELDLATKKAYSYLTARRRLARIKNYLRLQNRLPEGEQLRESDIKKITDSELGVDLFTQEMKMMAVSLPTTSIICNLKDI